jgi:membrane carboxypeptidase/penicillin-binding protein PbpC
MRILKLSLLLSFFILLSLYLYADRYDDPPGTKTFLDRNGRVIGTLDPAYRGVQYWTPIKEIPKEIIDKTIRTEDRFFYWHRGINPLSAIKAALENLSKGRVVRGGSTITQQLAKNLIGAPPRTFFNKFREGLLAIGLEIKHSKSWILERYLNAVYYGRRAYGIAAAAEVYFGKRLAELSEEDIAFLINRPKSPNRTSPLPSLRLSGRGAGGEGGRHFLEFVARNAPGDKNVLPTTLDLDLQKKIEEAVEQTLAPRLDNDPLLTVAVVVIDVRSGEILAMAGSRDYFNDEIDGQVNAAVALRQPGSTLKPFTYFAAFAKGFSANSIVPDEPTSFQAVGVEDAESYAPQNFDRRYHGRLTIREALANSYNVPAVVTLNEIGLSYYHDLLKKFGFTTLNRPPPHYGLAVTLGSGEVTLLELTNAYAALARGGGYLPYRMIRDGANTRFAPTPVITNAPQYAAAVTSILSDPNARLKAFGFNESLTIEGHEVAVKTGTSYDHRDNWTIGYTPSYAVGVWVGHADGSSIGFSTGEFSTGATGAAPLWHAVMENLLRGRPLERFPFSNPRIEIARDHNRPVAPAMKWRVMAPVPNATYRLHSYLPREHQKILAEVDFGTQNFAALRWYLNGRYLASTRDHPHRVWILPEPGRHTLLVVSGNGERQEIPFKVIDAEQVAEKPL